MMADIRNYPRGEILVKIRQMLPQIIMTRSLGEIIRKGIQVPQPSTAILPVSKTDGLRVLPVAWALCPTNQPAASRPSAVRDAAKR